MTGKIEIRNIREEDDETLAKIIRDTLTEFKASKPGTVFFDKGTDHMYESFHVGRSAYFVVLLDNVIAGGAGIFPTSGLPVDTCELVKMYLLPFARGKGIAKILIERCIEEAKKHHFKNMYLETMPELTSAISLYEKFGFHYLHNPIGNSGHSGCSIWMLKALTVAQEGLNTSAYVSKINSTS